MAAVLIQGGDVVNHDLYSANTDVLIEDGCIRFQFYVFMI